MSHIIPYISTEPPSIHDDSFETESCKSEICDNNLSRTKAVTIKDETLFATDRTDDSENCDNNLTQTKSVIINDDILFATHDTDYANNIGEALDMHKDNDIDAPVHDCVDSVIRDDDVLSDCSFEGQFDEYMNHINDVSNVSNFEAMECNDTYQDSYFIKQSEDGQEITDEYNFGDFGAFNPTLEIPNGFICEGNDKEFLRTFVNLPAHDMVDSASVEDSYIVKVDDLNVTTFSNADNSHILEEETISDVEEADNVEDSHEIDDDFDEFATFDNEIATTDLDDKTWKPSHSTNCFDDSVADIVESFRRTLIAVVSNVDSVSPSPIDDRHLPPTLSDDVISTQSLINDYGARLWKELINFDYSPAFIFHWMQSTSYENFMNSMGPDYKELLCSQRATLPLYSVNLTPLEPVPMESFNQNVQSTTSSSLDLTTHEKLGNNISDKNSDLDIKNLEDEFIFDTNPKDEGRTSHMISDNRSSLPNLSSAVIQSEGFGSMIKSMLKPLNAGKLTAPNKPMNAQTETVLRELPDLSYMTSRVLMFPVLASCEVEDTI